MLFKFQNNENIFDVNKENGVVYLTYPKFQNTNMVKHGFSTRIGGVSEGFCESMNLSFARGDKEESVRENFVRMAKALKIEVGDYVFSDQTHETNIRVVTKADRGKGISESLDYKRIDGLVTNEIGVCLSTFYADCVPLCFLDPVQKAIGLSHSGWRGTVGKIGAKTVLKMQEEYGSNPKDLLVGIGPSICQKCYEVGSDVIDFFQRSFVDSMHKEIFYRKENGKFQLNLWRANELVLKEVGVEKSQIETTNLCTCCNEKLLFSHRASKGKRGNLGAFLALK